MNCHSCGGFEHFTQEQEIEDEKKSYGCDSKETSSKCLYTAQGVFMCIRNNKADLNTKDMGIVDNESMIMESVRDSRMFKNSAPW